MEKWKRMEFEKATKIVTIAIAVLMITGIAAVEATKYDREDCPDCSNSGLAFVGTTIFYDDKYQAYCVYYSSDIDSIEDAYGRILLAQYSTTKKAVDKFNKGIRKEDNILSNDDIEHAYMAFDVYDKDSSEICIYGSLLRIDKNAIISVFMRINTRSTVNDNDIEEAKTIFRAFAKSAHHIKGWEGIPVLSEPEEKYTLDLEHYPPYYEPKAGKPEKSGDLIATLTDKKTKNPVPNKVIVFYVEKDEKNKGENLCKITRERILHQPYCEPFSIVSPPKIPNIEGISRLLDFSENKFLRLRSTDSKGEARTNYIHSLDIELISKELTKRGENGKITGTIKVVALTQEDLENEQESLEDKKWKIECEESVDIELSSVARITKISVHSKDGKIKDRKGAILVEKADGKIIPVYDKDYITQGKLSKKAKYTPYNLLRGDILLLNENDFIDVCWLTGTKMKITVKTGILEKDQLAKVHIGLDDAGWYEWVNQRIREPTMHIINFATTGASVVLMKDISTSYLASLGAIKTVASEAFSLGFWPSDTYRNPLMIECYSTILIDFDKTATTVYTVEGTGRLHNIKDNSTTNVTTGHKMSVSPDGTFSQISEFDRSELNDDLSYLLESIEKDESGTTAAPALTPKQSELEISKLYVGKPIYPRATEVDIYYDVKNIGTVDVDEYHVECRINDLKRNEMYKFVGSARSIASGKQQKFVAAKKWKIPSDAKIGPYIIDCTLIWDSKKDTAGREFFVTHPAKREDRTAELEISNLYAGKSEYLKGAGERVDVCYYVKNTGTVDISEYHVIYQIFDSEGKRYCWFISDMFGSIVAGKEDKWQSGVWKVPSDAKVGRYTVDAMVIWGLDRFSRETAYFFVN